jgi:hypothetical protein
MGEVFFTFRNNTYVYDIDACRLYELVSDHLREVKNHEIFHDIRYHSLEISREAALNVTSNET